MTSFGYPETTWRKSSFSVENGQCVEVARVGGNAAFRDSKCPSAGLLLLPGRAWAAFNVALKTAQREGPA